MYPKVTINYGVYITLIKFIHRTSGPKTITGPSRIAINNHPLDGTDRNTPKLKQQDWQPVI